MLKDIVFVQVLGGHRLQLRFEDGVEGEIDLASVIPFTGIFEPLRDPAYFAKVRVSPDLGTIVWPNDADVDPLVLYALVTGKKIPDYQPGPSAAAS